MDKCNILKNREYLNLFFKSDENVFEFDVNCEPKERIKFIYSIIFPGWRRVKFYIIFLIARAAQYIDYSPLKVLVYKLIGMKIGKGVFISPDVIIDPHFPSLITIEDYCIIGWGAKLFTHEFSEKKYRIGKIVIKKGAIIGGFAIIRGGSTIGAKIEIPFGVTVYRDVLNPSRAKQLKIRQIKDTV